MVKPAEWGMAPITQPVAARQLDDVDEANVHHSDSEPSIEHRKCAGQVRGFDTFHRAGRGWSCIGYHRVICPHGFVYLGRSLLVVPAAAYGHNTPIVAYCLIAKRGSATPAQWAALLAMAARDARTAGRALTLTTHREVTPTDCPGDRIQQQVDEYRQAHGDRIRPAVVDPDRKGIMSDLPHLRPGSTGQAVVNLQALLNVADPAADPPLDTDGLFGDATEHAVKRWQRRHDRSPDGFVAAAEWRHLLIP